MANEEKKNENAEAGDATPRCRTGSKTDNPCCRAAVLSRFVDEDEYRLCAEHARVVELEEDFEDWYMNLRVIDEWVKGPVAEAGDDNLTRLAYNARDEARREYGILAVRIRAAGRVADQGPGEASLALEQEEEFARYMMREEVLTNVRTILEDVDEDALPLRDKWAAIDAVAIAASDAADEAVRLRGELLGGPE